jgi:hypothetical protein
MSERPWNTDFKIKACRFEVAGRRMILGEFSAEMVVAIRDVQTGETCLYQFSNARHVRLDAKERSEVWQFVRGNPDPWQRFTLEFPRAVNDLAASAAQLYSDPVDEKAGEDVHHRARLVLWIDPGHTGTISFRVCYPEPLNGFTADGEFRRVTS